MSRYLIQISIGPVQEFIASARKLRDLWYGSFLLSELSKTVARELNNNGAELIFPAINNANDLAKNSELIVANKILAEIELSSSPELLITAIKNAWELHRQEIADNACAKMQAIRIKFNENRFKQQALDSGEFYAAWIQYDTTKTYKETKAQLEKLLAGRKNLRTFTPPAWDGSGVPKNSLDGIRETVILTQQKEVKGLLKKNEKLDALACIKRFGALNQDKQSQRFDYLSQIAFRSYQAAYWNSKHQQQITEFIQRFDPDFNPESAIKETSVSPFYEELTDENLTARKKLTKATTTPQKYACILMGDGDNMGQILDGIDSADGHRVFSKGLEQFARQVGETINKQEGSLIYAGGDDVLAYIPLYSMIETVDQVRKDFQSSMDAILNELNLKLQAPTFSIGVAIIHHSQPLDQALNMARQAEQIAKIEGGRNALAVIQNKRGGNPRQTFGKWDSEPQHDGIADRLNNIVTMHQLKILPGTLAYQMRSIAKETGDQIIFSNNNEKLIPENASATLLLRLFDQKQHTSKLIILFKGQKSINKLSNEIIIGQQIANDMIISQGEPECATE